MGAQARLIHSKCIDFAEHYRHKTKGIKTTIIQQNSKISIDTFIGGYFNIK